MAGLMGFECVVRALRSGFQVRRPGWSTDEHLELVRELLFESSQNSNDAILRCREGRCFEYVANSEDILATDWERYVLRKTT